MKVAVIDIAAEKSGALSVLLDFYNYIKSSFDCMQNEWHFFLYKKFFEESKNIKIHLCEKEKESRFKRIKWDNFIFKKIDKNERFDVTLSLQSAAVKTYKSKLVVYFHNALLLESKKTFSFFKKNERNYAIYTHLIGPYTLKSLKKANAIITQTETIKNKIANKIKLKKDIFVVNPNLSNIKVNKEYRWNGNIKGFIYPATPIILKRHELIVSFAKELEKIYPQLKILFTFNGDENNYAEHIKNIAHDTHNIEFIGFLDRSKIMELYSSYSLIWSSKIESFPIPFIEASMIGCPILVPNEEYALEILKKYNNVFFYERQNINSMVECAKTILETNNVKPLFSNKNVNTWGKVVNILKLVLNSDK